MRQVCATKKFGLLCATAMVALPAIGHAQSTGTQTFENSSIVVTGKQEKDKTVAGTSIPDTPKAREVLDSEFLQRQVPGQSVDDIINMLPGVSFQNNGPYGDAGGTLSIHGFDGSRISQTLDGIPMNDSGNYALYSQEQIDTELIDRVEVSLGSTDIDSPTASATGSTVNYVTRNPYDDFHARMSGSAGQWDYQRIFGVIDTGVFTAIGTKAFISASSISDDFPYDERAKLKKWQANAKIFQPIGANGDFISVAGWYSEGRGNRFGDLQLKDTSGNFPTSADARNLSVASCQTTKPTTGKDTANSCGTTYDLGSNPSNRANIRANSRFTLADGLTLTVDPSYNYTKSNGTTDVAATEAFNTAAIKGKSLTGYIGGKPYFGGVDLNGDGDTLDTVEVNAPSNTITNRFVVVSNLIYKITPTQTVRVNYTFDHSRLRQTGEVGLLKTNGEPASYFPSDDPLLDATGSPIEKRDRTSYSILNQVSGEYRGEFFDSKLVIQAGVRVPFFKRDLTNNCVSEDSGTGYVDCFNAPASQAAFLTAHPTYQAPQSRTYNYNRVLPSAGFTYSLTRAASLFFDYSQGIQVPSTDDLYDSFAFNQGTPGAAPKPETTYNFEGGVRYKRHNIQAELSGWYTIYHNRIAEAAIPDPENDTDTVTIYTNLGTVHKYGVDASFAYEPIQHLSLYAFGSYLKSKIENDVFAGNCTQANITNHVSAGTSPCATVGQTIYALTAGRRESGSPTYTVGGRAQGNFGPFSVGIQAKRTGPRYVNDQNTPFFTAPTAAVPSVEIFDAKAPAYTLVDLDARLNLGFLGLNDRTWLQINVHNVFDKFYVGGFAGGTVSNTFVPYAYIGTPRTISGTINVGF